MTENEVLLEIIIRLAAFHPSETPRRVLRRARDITDLLIEQGLVSQPTQPTQTQRSKEESDIIPP